MRIIYILFVVLCCALFFGCNSDSIVEYNSQEGEKLLAGYEEIWKKAMIDGEFFYYSVDIDGNFVENNVSGMGLEENQGVNINLIPSEDMIIINDPSNSGWVLNGGIVGRINSPDGVVQLYGLEKRHYQMKKWGWDNYIDHISYDFFLVNRSVYGESGIVLKEWMSVPINDGAGDLRYDSVNAEIAVLLGHSKEYVLDFDLGLNHSCSYKFQSNFGDSCWDKQ